jgi:MarR family transcriptional regulator, organic hydroperoxide resistance regulator
MYEPSGLPEDEALQPLWPAGFGAWIKIGLVYQRTYRLLAERLKPLALSVAQFDALANLYVGDGIHQQELATRLLVTKGNVTGLLNRLVERDLVARQSDPSDGRARRVLLTKRGRRVARRALMIQRDLVDEMMGGLSQHDRDSLRRTLTRLAARIDSQV